MIGDVVESVLGKKPGAPRWTTRARCIYRLRMRLSEFHTSINTLDEAGMIVEQVVALRRLVR